MKKFLLLLASFLLVGTMMARQLTPDEALALAMGKMNVAQSERARALAYGTNTERVCLMHTETINQDVPLYYVYNIAEGGIIIASADDRTSSLLGYTDGGDFAAAMQSPTFVAWLKDCRKALLQISREPEDQMPSASARSRALTTSVSPLLGDIIWDQDGAYNLLTPMRVGKRNAAAEPDTIHAPTGCVATAIAQVMMYHQWPVTGAGSHTNKEDSTQTIDFSQSTYQWSKMLLAYKGGESEESMLAVAQLMNDVGCALDMDYGYHSSGATDDAVARALSTYFGYDKGMLTLYRTMCSTEEWNGLLMTELDEKRPVLFGAGATSGGGHEFVVDGYDANGLYHVNWGWGGYGNGYFDINLMDPNYQGIGGFEGGYTIGQVMVLGVKPDVAGTSVARPELMLTRHFSFDEEIGQWTFGVTNYGLGDFTGEIGVAMESPAGQVSKVTTYKWDEAPFGFFKYCRYKFDAPVVTDSGYVLYPYYSDEVGGEIKRITSPYSSLCTLHSVESDGAYSWKYDIAEIADITINSIKVKHNFVGYAPQLNITLTNEATSAKEYNAELYVEVTKMVDGVEKLVCHGRGQAFLNPGGRKEIIVRCNNETEEFKGKIVKGKYKYYLYDKIGGVYYDLYAKDFEMVIAPPSNIIYSDFTINKTQFQPGEKLTASMTATNIGGYDVKTLAFVIFRKSDKVMVKAIELRNVDFEADSSETYTFENVLTYDPDEYLGLFFADGQRLTEADIFEITVDYPTALDKLKSASGNHGTSGIYDLQGRPAQQVRKGELYFKKGKLVIK